MRLEVRDRIAAVLWMLLLGYVQNTFYSTHLAFFPGVSLKSMGYIHAVIPI